MTASGGSSNLTSGIAAGGGGSSHGLDPGPVARVAAYGRAQDQLNHPARAMRFRKASAFLNSAFTCGHVSGPHRVWSIVRIRSETRSHGCCQSGLDAGGMAGT